MTLPARPRSEELVFAIFVEGHTFKMGPAERNPDGLAHAVVKPAGERRYDVGFEDLLNGGDRDYDDNTFRFSGGLAPNRSPVAEDQALTVDQGSSLPIALTATDEDGDALTYAIADGPRHGTLSGTGSELTYAPDPAFSGARHVRLHRRRRHERARRGARHDRRVSGRPARAGRPVGNPAPPARRPAPVSATAPPAS